MLHIRAFSLSISNSKQFIPVNTDICLQNREASLIRDSTVSFFINNNLKFSLVSDSGYLQPFPFYPTLQLNKKYMHSQIVTKLIPLQSIAILSLYFDPFILLIGLHQSATPTNPYSLPILNHLFSAVNKFYIYPNYK